MSSAAATVTMMIPIREPGIAAWMRGSPIMHAATMTTAARAQPRWVGSAVDRAVTADTTTLVWLAPCSPGSASEGTCWAKMITPMPRVKPSITGQGMNDTARPSRSTPATSTITPAIRDRAATAPIPWVATTGASTTTMAPVGPDTWTWEPPKIAAISPATIAVIRPASAPTPEEMPKPSARGSATIPTVSPAIRSLRQLRGSSR